MVDHPDYSVLVAQAEMAVASVKDPELKRVAFQKVLDVLLTTGARSSKEKPKASGRETAGNKTVTIPAAAVQRHIFRRWLEKDSLRSRKLLQRLRPNLRIKAITFR